MGVNESEMREVLLTNLSSRMYSISMVTAQLYCTALQPQWARSKNRIKTFSFARQKSAGCFPDLPPSSSRFLLSSFSLLPSLYFLCTQECFVGSWDKRNKRHHWQKRLSAHPCVWTCVIMWEWDCNYMQFFFSCYCRHVCVCVCFFFLLKNGVLFPAARTSVKVATLHGTWDEKWVNITRPYIYSVM